MMAVFDTEFAENISDVFLNGAQAEAEDGSDLAVLCTLAACRTEKIIHGTSFRSLMA